jgi:hypothetical protein
MPASPHIRPSKDKDAAAVLVELLKPGAWIPPVTRAVVPVIEALLEAFLRHFDRRGTGPASGSPVRPSAIRISAQRARREWRGALHKICQMLARNPRLPAEARAALAPLESLPPEAIPDTASLGGGRSCRAGAAKFGAGPGESESCSRQRGRCLPVSGSNF